ncbi:MAG TPA: conjugal transfer protein TraL [Firmicutes bacterium]|nr:conjugal transfer protein TraL [Bacillota bacterium]
MHRAWAEKLSIPFAVGGGLCLAAAVAVCAGLERGGPLDRAGVAVAMLALAGLALGLLRLERVEGRKLLLMLLPIGVGVLLRASMLDYAGTDYTGFLANWYRFFQDNGGFSAIAHSVGDYNVPYLYFLAAITYIPMPDLYLIKLFSILFDVILAWGGFRLVRAVARPEWSGVAAPVAFGVLFLLPTVLLNGAYWAQCDVVYGALTVLAIALVLEGRNKRSVALMAVAFSFKLQTIFVLPLWGVLWLAKRVKFRQLWVFPGVYFLTILPALLLGKPLGEILGIYVNQASQYPRLTLNAPSVYQFVPYGTESGGNHYALVGIVAAGVLVLALLGVGLWLGRRMDRRLALTIGLVLAIGVPFLLPHMHERYFFLADVISACWACVSLAGISTAALVSVSSLASYRVFLRLKFNYVLNLFGNQYGMPIEASVMLAALVTAGVWMVWELKRCTRAAEHEVELW